MRNMNSKVRCEKRQFSKCKEVVRTYNQLQSKFAEMLEKDENIKEFVCNYLLMDFFITDGKYTTDFYCTTSDGEVVVYECVFRKHLTKPLTAKLLDASRFYWERLGIKWRLVVDAEE